MNDVNFYPYLKFDGKYAYASARVRSLETQFLDNQKLNKLIVSKDVRHFIGELSDSPYKKYIDKLEKNEEFEELLFETFKDIIEELTDLSFEKRIKDLFNLYFDTYNVKMIFKLDRFKKDVISKLYNYGNITKDIINTEGHIDNAKIPERYKELFIRIEQGMEKQRSGSAVNEIVDVFYFEEMAKFSKLFRSDFLYIVNKHNIELTNAQTILRHKLFDFMQVRFIPAGFTALHILERMKEQSFQDIVRYFSQKGYERLFEKKNDELDILRSFIQKHGEYINDLLSSSKYIPMGIEVLIVYFYRKREELRTLRKIFLSKLRNIPQQDIERIIYG